MTSWGNDLVTELERIGEAEVRTRLARGEFGMVGSSKSTAVKAWLNSKESERRAAWETKGLANSEEAFSTARTAAAAAAEAISCSPAGRRDLGSSARRRHYQAFIQGL